MSRDYTLKSNEREAVRKGGRIVHVIALNADGKCERLTKALCGDGPKEKNVRSFTRAGWYGSIRAVTCKKCLAILAEREVTNDD